MTGESDNLPTGGTDTAQPTLTLDEAANFDFGDPETDTAEAAEDQQSEGVTDEAGSQEADDTTAEDDEQTEAEAEGAEEEAANPEPKDDVTVTVNGEQIALSDLKAGYMRQADYSRKTQEVANGRRDLEAMTARVNQTVGAIADFLVKQIPEAPDPSLAMTNPSEFVQRKAMHEAAVAQVNALLSRAGEAKNVANQLTAQQRADVLRDENTKLAEAFPTTVTDEGRKKFFEEAASAAKELGYTDDEIKTVADHRMFKLAHYAMLGLRAEQAKAKAAKKVASVPPVAPQKRQQGANAVVSQRKQEAMKRLAHTGSLDDAVLAWTGD